jgi:hypothetical protein
LFRLVCQASVVSQYFAMLIRAVRVAKLQQSRGSMLIHMQVHRIEEFDVFRSLLKIDFILRVLVTINFIFWFSENGSY